MRRAAVTLVAAAALLAGAAGRAAETHIPAGTIAFSAGPLEPGRSHVYVVGANGAHLRRLTDGGIDFDPALSPDGKRIAFRGNRGGNEDLYLVNIDGSGLRRLTRNPGMDYAPAWSPDGRRIVFASIRAGNYPHLWTMDADGRRQRIVTAQVTGEYPAFSPDGKRLAFASNQGATDAGFELYVVDADGSHVERLTRNGVYDMGPAWSPDGRLIAFYRGRGGGSLPDVYVMRADGSGVRRLTQGGGELPSWSPDGRFLAYAGTAGLTIVRADGRPFTRLRLPEQPNFASWARGSAAAAR